MRGAQLFPINADIDRPILTPKTVLPLFFVIGIIFAPIGGLLYWASTQVRLRICCRTVRDGAHIFRYKNFESTTPTA